jgi:translation initiation factor 3 subunit K
VHHSEIQKYGKSVSKLCYSQIAEPQIGHIMYLADILESCDFQQFWGRVHSMPELCSQITGFHDSIRKFVCHVVGITFQTVDRIVLAKLLGGVDGKRKNIFTSCLSIESCLLVL